MIVLGGGPVGCELSQAWASLGTRVTLIEGGEQLLGREEPFAGEEVAAALRGRFGVDVRTGAQAESRRSGRRRSRRRAERRRTVEGEEILVAVGRVPHTAELDLGAAGVEAGEHGFLETDDRMRVGGREWLYAIGDVNGRALLTHVGKYQAWVAAENLLGREVEAVAEALGSPRVTFTDPQVAAVGKTLEQAREAGIDARAVDVPTDGSAGRQLPGQGHRRHLAPGRRPGATGRSSAPPSPASRPPTSCMRRRSRSSAEVPLPRLRHAIAASRRRSEIWLKLLETLRGA